MSAEVVSGLSPVTKPNSRTPRPLLRIGCAAIVVFLGYKIIPFYYYYFDLKSNAAQVIKNAAVESDDEIRRSLFEVVKRNGVSVDPREIRIQRNGGRIRIWMSYKEVLDVAVFGRTVELYTFEFVPSAERSYEE